MYLHIRTRKNTRDSGTVEVRIVQSAWLRLTNLASWIFDGLKFALFNSFSVMNRPIYAVL